MTSPLCWGRRNTQRTSATCIYQLMHISWRDGSVLTLRTSKHWLRTEYGVNEICGTVQYQYCTNILRIVASRSIVRQMTIGGALVLVTFSRYSILCRSIQMKDSKSIHVNIIKDIKQKFNVYNIYALNVGNLVFKIGTCICLYVIKATLLI